jgi:hypothetical protein
VFPPGRAALGPLIMAGKLSGGGWSLKS